MKRKVCIIFCVELLLIFSEVLTADPVTFSNIEVVAIRDNSVVIRWDTDIPATGQVEYGLGTSYGLLTDEDGLSYWQQIEVTGLTEGTGYHFRIRAVDYEENETISGDSTFITRTQAELDSIVRAARTMGDLPKVYYIKTDGNDSYNGLSIDSAWATLSYAQYQLQPGDSLLILDGSYYNDEFVAQINGIPEFPITIKAYNGTPTFIESGTARTLNLFNFGDPYAAPGAPYPIEYYNVDGFRAENYDQTFTTYYESNNLNLTNIYTKNCKYAVHFHRGCHNIIMRNFTVENAYYAPFHFWYYNHHNKLENAIVTGTIYDHGLIDFHTDNDYCTIDSVSFNGEMTAGEAIYVHGDYGTNDYNVLMNIEIEMMVTDTTTGYECVDIWSIGYGNYFENFILTQIKGRCSVVSLGSAEESGDFHLKNATLVSAGGHGVYIEPPNHIASITLENLTIENVNHAEYYSDIVVHFPQYIDSLVLRDIKGDSSNFNIDTYEGLTNVEIIEFTDNRVFSTNYVNTSPVYYPDRSGVSVEEEGNRLVSYYNATIVPSIDSLSVLVIQWDTTGTFYKKWQEICESPAVITSHTVGDLHPNSIVEVKVNSIHYDTFTADTAGWIAFDYTGGFSQDTVIFEAEVISSVVEEIIVNKNPSIYSLSQNFPNPFHSSTEIRYQLPADNSTEHVRLDIFDASGRLVRNLINERYKAGYYQVTWDGKDINNQSVSGGIYFYHLIAGNYKTEEKMILLR